MDSQLTPDEKEAAHNALYEKEFKIQLDVSLADNKLRPMGAHLDWDADFEPVKITKIRKTGLIEMWNKGHHDKKVLNGDEIWHVNEIGWHWNSKNFSAHLMGQIHSAAKGRISPVLKLTIRRPRKQKDIRVQSQRDDRRSQLYAKEWGISFTSAANASEGFSLNSTENWNPVSVLSIDCDSYLAKFNKDNPDDAVHVGDQILAVNNIRYKHHSARFIKHLKAQFVHAGESPGSEINLKLARPMEFADKEDTGPDCGYTRFSQLAEQRMLAAKKGAENGASGDVKNQDAESLPQKHAKVEEDDIVGASDDEVGGSNDDDDDEIVGASGTEADAGDDEVAGAVGNGNGGGDLN